MNKRVMVTLVGAVFVTSAIVYWLRPLSQDIEKRSRAKILRNKTRRMIPTKPVPIRRWVSVDDLPQEIAVFKDVFWVAADTSSLRKMIRQTSVVKGKTVLEIGTGSGLVALCCLQAGAKSVVATDVNPNACANAIYNAKRLGFADRLTVHLVPVEESAAFAVIDDSETFDVIISNPPWENNEPRSFAEHALYDPDFALLKSLMKGLRKHLNPRGKALLAYGCVSAIRALYGLAEKEDLRVRKLDDRSLDKLHEVFLPGMLLEVSRKNEAMSRGE